MILQVPFCRLRDSNDSYFVGLGYGGSYIPWWEVPERSWSVWSHLWKFGLLAWKKTLILGWTMLNFKGLFHPNTQTWLGIYSYPWIWVVFLRGEGIHSNMEPEKWRLGNCLFLGFGLFSGANMLILGRVFLETSFKLPLSLGDQRW